MKNLFLSTLILACLLGGVSKKTNAAIVFGVVLKDRPLHNTVATISLFTGLAGAAVVMFTDADNYPLAFGSFGVGMLLNEDSTNPRIGRIEERFPSLPSYVFEDIISLAQTKSFKTLKDDEIVFTNEEVDGLFYALETDDSIEPKELTDLRALLTTQSK